jgi:hypothetical protein
VTPPVGTPDHAELAPVVFRTFGRTQMPPTLSRVRHRRVLTQSKSELQAVLSRYGVGMRLGTAPQIGFLKMCGRPLDKFQRATHRGSRAFERPSWRFATRLGYVARFLLHAPRVLYRHQQIALDALGLVVFAIQR